MDTSDSLSEVDLAIATGRMLGLEFEHVQVGGDRPDPVHVTNDLKRFSMDAACLSVGANEDDCQALIDTLGECRKNAGPLEDNIQRLRGEWARVSRGRGWNVIDGRDHFPSAHEALYLRSRARMFVALAAINHKKIMDAAEGRGPIEFPHEELRKRWAVVREAIKRSQSEFDDVRLRLLPQLDLELAELQANAPKVSGATIGDLVQLLTHPYEAALEVIGKTPVSTPAPAASTDGSNGEISAPSGVPKDGKQDLAVEIAATTAQVTYLGKSHNVTLAWAQAFEKMLGAKGLPVGIGGGDPLRKPVDDLKWLKVNAPELYYLVAKGPGNSGYRLTIFD